MNHPKVAIVGSGPSGCYAAQFILKYWEYAEISFFESLPVPYGLARYGIAADHQGNKAFIKQFDRLFERENVHFIGNVTVGRDLQLSDLDSNFDYVIQATGLFKDKELTVPVDKNACVLGAGHLLRSINSCPLSKYPNFNNDFGHLGQEIAIIGAGNVAIDVARLLSKRDEDLIGSDVDDLFLNHVRPQAIKKIHILNRSDLNEAKFDLSMFKELLHLPHVKLSIHGHVNHSHHLIELIEDSENLNRDEIITEIIFHFNHSPKSIEKLNQKTLLNIKESQFHRSQQFYVDSVITAIGFEGQQCEQHSKHPNMIQVGWFKRGSVGNVADNRKDTKKVIDELFTNFKSQPIEFQKGGLKDIQALLPSNAVSFDDWKTIELYERANAAENRCRTKINSIQKMLAVLEKNKQYRILNTQIPTVA